MDKNWSDLAKILVNYSVEVKAGEKVLITMMEIGTYPLARACYQECIKAGALPFVEFQSVSLERDLLLLGNEEQVEWVNDMHMKGMEWADCYIGLRGARNPHEFHGVQDAVLTAHKRMMGKISAARSTTRWVLSRVPNESFAQQAGISVDEMMDFYFKATLVDWHAQTAYLESIKRLYESGTNVRIVGRETELRFSTKGRIYETADGKCNMPDGELFTSPVENSINGHIYFEFPGVYAGKNIEGIRLSFENGKLLSATSETESVMFQEILAMDEGASRVGEFGIGLNYGIDRYCYDILFDEKIGGTVHIAMGRGYSECGGQNMSALHWDIVKDLRREGEIYVDDVLIFKNGSYIGV